MPSTFAKENSTRFSAGLSSVLANTSRFGQLLVNKEERHKEISLNKVLYAIDPVEVEAQHAQRLNGAFVINLGTIPVDGVIVAEILVWAMELSECDRNVYMSANGYADLYKEDPKPRYCLSIPWSSDIPNDTLPNLAFIVVVPTLTPSTQ